ncbi:MAG: NAD(P)H-dependent oxidoreductase [Candidatus Methanoperedens sp.]|nr:NAD(P)H-dependent oxidoreductase [Candidatus Methanoperedens sp.]
MMNHLIIYSHPNPKSFCHAILETAVKELKSKGHEVAVRDLYELGFDPVLKGSDFVGFQSGNMPPDIKAEQEYIARADVITFIYPIWWTGLPSMIKGYIDRVFSLDFAYAAGEWGPVGLLTEKKAVIFNTAGATKEIYDESGLFDAMKKTSDMGIFNFCGIEVLEHKFFTSVPSTDDATRKGYLSKVKEVMGRF